MKSAGYSGTPLAKKLGLKPGSIILTINAPKGYKSWLAPLPAAVQFVSKAPSGGTDIVHLFVKSSAEFTEQLPKARKAIKSDGTIWVSWYKQPAGIPTDVTGDMVRSRALKTDLVDVKVCAVTDIWSGLKLVVRKHLR
jgi:hypothetical protein